MANHDHVEDIDYAAAKELEKKLRHDVMSHIHAWGDQCPTARPVIHLGATSCFVCDNTELIQLRSGMELIVQRLVEVRLTVVCLPSTTRDGSLIRNTGANNPSEAPSW